jgi:Domain of unknown function (DUF4180)
MNEMPLLPQFIHGIPVLLCEAEGKKLRHDSDAIEVIGEALHQSVELVGIPVERFGDDFFQLNTRIAGEIIQKFVMYKLRVAIVGDISRHVEASLALRDFVYEANRGNQLWFVASLSELKARLEESQARL